MDKTTQSLNDSEERPPTPSTSATDCLVRLVSEMTCYVSSGTLNYTTALVGIHCKHYLSTLIQCRQNCARHREIHYSLKQM